MKNTIFKVGWAVHLCHQSPHVTSPGLWQPFPAEKPRGSGVFVRQKPQQQILGGFDSCCPSSINQWITLENCSVCTHPVLSVPETAHIVQPRRVQFPSCSSPALICQYIEKLGIDTLEITKSRSPNYCFACKLHWRKSCFERLANYLCPDVCGSSHFSGIVQSTR